MKVAILIVNGWKGEIDRPEIDSARGFYIHSRAKVCPVCLEVWALIRTEKGGPFGIESQFCAGCRQGFDGEVVPGSLLDDRVSWTVDWDLVRYLPMALLQREFDLHVRAIQEDSHEQSFDLGIGIAKPFLEGGPNPGHYHGAEPPSGR
jgi:hypothetical protein